MKVQRGPSFVLDPVLVCLVLAVLLLGLVMLTSASISKAARDAGDVLFFVKGQLQGIGAGLLLGAVLTRIPTEVYLRHANLLLVLAAVLLVAVLVPGIGHEVNGSRRWIRLPGFQLQASELTRVLVLTWVAAYAARRSKELAGSFTGLATPLGFTLVFCVLLVLEPDFGAAAVLFATAFGLLFIAGAQLRWVLLSMLGAGVAFAAVAVLEDYRMRRLTCFLNPWAHAQECGYQPVQSLIAIGRGEWFGVGLGESVQKLFYLPEAHTDFLFAVLAEELGLVGVVVTLGLFVALAWRALHIAREAATAGLRFQAGIAAAFGLWVGIQSLINIGVTMSVLPTKGLTLPFMSFGRSSIMVALLWLGMVLRVHHETMVRVRGGASVGARRAVREVAA